MSTPMNFAQTGMIKPPEKGSFPIDHEGECKEYMFKFMKCLRRNAQEHSKCRDESAWYLDCRMKHNLMAHEEWKNLGFTDLPEELLQSAEKKE